MVQEIDTIKLAANKRDICGSHRVNRLRKDGWLPGIVYDSKGQSQPIQLKRHEFELLLRKRADENLIMDLALDNAAPRKVLLKDVQRDHIRDHLTHVDFLEISLTRKLRVPVAIRLTGEPFGVSQEGGILEHLLRTVDVECLPMDIAKEFVLDVSQLKIGDSLFVRDLKIDPKKMTLLTAPDIAVASVLLPHIEEEVKPEEAAVEGAVEPEVIGEKKEGEVEGEGETKEGPEAKGKEVKGKEPEAKAEKWKEAKGKDKGKEKK
ncbi:MAG: 50S ribosomal protein L25 [Kiritimatiellaeota bacterium]|nr:50S ribosomal protein L25 [Kiritimatiellota bacterium]